jgi:cell division inhibitor SepF
VRRNARAWLGLVEHDNDAPVDEDGYASEDFSEVQDDDEIPSDQLAMGYGIQIAVVRPRNFRDAATVGEYFRQEIPVIINLEDVDNAGATRIIDFVSGLILGRRGDIERLSRRTFLIVPAGATILTTHDGLTDESFFNQALRPVNDSPVIPPGPGDDFAHERSLPRLSFEVKYGTQCDVDLHEFFRIGAAREISGQRACLIRLGAPGGVAQGPSAGRREPVTGPSALQG